MSTEIIIAHRSNFLCEILRESLERRDFNVLSFTTSGTEALDSIRERKPKIAVLNNSLSDISGIEIVKTLREENTDCKFLFLSQDTEEASVVDSELSVEGHVLAFDSMSQFFFALHEINGGRTYLSPSAEKLVRKPAVTSSLSLNTSISELKILTPREIEIMQALSESCTTPQIAERFLISPATVNNHRANIMHKLKLKGRNQLMRLAISMRPSYFATA